MLTFRNTLVFFFFVISAFIVADIFIRISPWWYIGIILVLLALLTLGSVYIQMQFYLHSHVAGNRNRKEIVLSFDDGPDENITPRVLDLLQEHRIKAVFFIIGSKAVRNPDLVRRIHREGHILGGHSFSHHFFFDLFTAQMMKNELKLTVEAIQKITGITTRIFRPPYGVTNPTLAGVLRNSTYESIGWSLKSRDTVTPDEIKLFSRLKEKTRPGDIILFHDTMPVDLDVLPKFIAFLKQEQYQIVPLDQMLKIKVYG